MLRVCALALLLCTTTGFAGVITLTGNLNAEDPNDVFLYAFVMPAGGDLVIQSWGYGGGVNAAAATILAGGFDPYISLFAGTGDGATFLASNDDGLCPPASGDPNCRDSQLVQAWLAPGTYTLAISTFGNLSFAENLGTGTLGDGFVGLGSYFDMDNMADRGSAFAVDLTSESDLAAVPEPGLALPALAALALLACRSRRPEHSRRNP